MCSNILSVQYSLVLTLYWNSRSQETLKGFLGNLLLHRNWFRFSDSIRFSIHWWRTSYIISQGYTSPMHVYCLYNGRVIMKVRSRVSFSISGFQMASHLRCRFKFLINVTSLFMINLFLLFQWNERSFCTHWSKSKLFFVIFSNGRKPEYCFTKKKFLYLELSFTRLSTAF